jgi:phosphoglycerate dehydrogenase-like enzyme
MVTIVSFSPVPGALLHQWLAAHLGAMAFRVVAADEVSGADRDQAFREAEAALGDYTFRHPVDRQLLEKMPKLKFLQQPSAGYEHIDLDACRARAVQVANTPGVNAAAVAEHAIMVALALLKRLISANASTHAGKWTQHELMWERGVFELGGKTWGIVGFGAVGREVAKRLTAFGVNLLYYDVQRLGLEKESDARVTYKPLDHLLRLADIVSLHVPLTPETRSLIGSRELSFLKSHAILINVARGECVDERALADRLRTKKLGGAGIDVFSQEPIPPDHPLLECDNALLTPHIAGATNEVRERVVRMAVANIVQFLQGRQPQYVLNRTTS